MKEELNKKLGEEFEQQKKDVEWNNKQENAKYLASKFSEILAKNPIIVYVKHGNFKTEDNGIKFDKVKETRTDESGTGGYIEVIFNDRDSIAVNKDKFSGSNFFEKQSDYYKITKESYQSILTMMDRLIKISGYTEVEKEKMFQMVVDNFKNKIIKDKDLKQIKE